MSAALLIVAGVIALGLAVVGLCAVLVGGAAERAMLEEEAALFPASDPGA